MKIGCIGLGLMGRPMAANLPYAGHRLFAYDLEPVPQELCNACAARGGNAGNHSAMVHALEVTTVDIDLNGSHKLLARPFAAGRRCSRGALLGSSGHSARNRCRTT